MLPVMLAKDLAKQKINRWEAGFYKEHMEQLISRLTEEALLFGVITSAIPSALSDKTRFELAVVDEGSQITEPEFLPIRADSLIIAGDPKQLGTNESSAVACKNPFGNMLGVSILDRLRVLDGTLDVYELCRSFRSHPGILEPLSQIHYNGNLFADAKNKWIKDTMIADLALDRLDETWDGFPQRRNTLVALNSFPIKDDSGESYSSPLETNAGLDIVEVLVSRSGIRLEDIGINAAYGSATRCTRQEAIIRWGGNAASKLLIGTADGLQGQDRHIMIHLMTAAFGADEDKGMFGFTSNRRRSCVAMSLAQQLNICIGNYTFWRQRVPIHMDNAGNNNARAIWDLVKYVEARDAIYHGMGLLLRHFRKSIKLAGNTERSANRVCVSYPMASTMPFVSAPEM